MATCDFVIVKATGGAGYKNECFERHANDTLAAGKLLGCYHYARDRGYEGSAEAEADHFIDAFKPYVGKAIPVPGLGGRRAGSGAVLGQEVA